MSLLIKPQPFSSDFDRLFNTLLGGDSGRAQRWYPAMDLVEAEDSYLLKADLPGLSEEDVTIEVSDGVLRVSGERGEDSDQRGKGWYRVERTFGKFSRSLTLPDGVDADQISASFDKGVLQVSIPKPAERAPKRIEIKQSADEAPVIEGSAKEN
jgi:HSP20 family protein